MTRAPPPASTSPGFSSGLRTSRDRPQSALDSGRPRGECAPVASGRDRGLEGPGSREQPPPLEERGAGPRRPAHPVSPRSRVRGDPRVPPVEPRGRTWRQAGRGAARQRVPGLGQGAGGTRGVGGAGRRVGRAPLSAPRRDLGHPGSWRPPRSPARSWSSLSGAGRGRRRLCRVSRPRLPRGSVLADKARRDRRPRPGLLTSGK